MSGKILLTPGAPKKLRRRVKTAAGALPDRWIENRQLSQWDSKLFAEQAATSHNRPTWEFDVPHLEVGLFVTITTVLSLGTAISIGILTGYFGWGALGIFSVLPYFFIVLLGYEVKDYFKARRILATLTQSIDRYDVVVIPNELLKRWHRAAEAHGIDEKYADNTLDYERAAFVDPIKWHALACMTGVTEENSAVLNKRIDARLEQIAAKVATQAVTTGQIVGPDSLNQYVQAITDLPDSFLP